jgi:hypothetical protein
MLKGIGRGFKQVSNQQNPLENSIKEKKIMSSGGEQFEHKVINKLQTIQERSNPHKRQFNN